MSLSDLCASNSRPHLMSFGRTQLELSKVEACFARFDERCFWGKTKVAILDYHFAHRAIHQCDLQFGIGSHRERIARLGLQPQLKRLSGIAHVFGEFPVRIALELEAETPREFQSYGLYECIH